MTMLRKLFCNQTFLQATNARRTDRQRHRHSRGRIHTHTPRVCRLCCLLQAPRSLSLSVGPQPVCVGGERGNHNAKTTMTMLRKLFCNQICLRATNASRTERQRHRHSRGRIHPHLASLACVVSCWRLVAFLCRFARNLSALASSVSLLGVAAAL